MKKKLKTQQYLNMVNAKLDFLIHAQGKTVVTKDALGGGKTVFISGEEQFISWINERKNPKKPIPKEKK